MTARRFAAFRLLTVLSALTVVNLACSSDGGSSSTAKQESDPEKARIAERRAAWPAETGDFSDPVDLTGYTTLTLVPFDNLTDNSRDDDAGRELVEEIEDTLNDRYEDAFATVRIADAPLGTEGEVVAEGFVYDFSKGGGYNYFTGRNRAKFKAMMKLTDGASGAVLKSSRIKQSGHDSNDAMLEEAADKFARMLNRGVAGR